MHNKLKPFISLFVLTILCVFPLSAEYPDYENVYVNDWANLLDNQAEEEITQKLKNLRAEADVEITLVTINRMSDYQGTKRSIEGFALELFNQWGVGNAIRNDGVLVLVSRFDRKMRIATGKGYDNTNKNAAAKSVIDNYFIPSFKRDNYQQGILRGMDKVIFTFNPNASLPVGLLDSTQHTITDTTSKAWYELKNSQFLVFILIFGGIVLLNLLKSIFSGIFSGKAQAPEFFTQGNYSIDEQPKKFKQRFPNEKKVNIKVYFGWLALGLMALTFISAFIGFNFFIVSLFALLSGVGFTYARAEFRMRKRNKPKPCPRCTNLMDRVSERKDDEHLHLPERVEESLKSVDYDVWLCSDCQRTKKLRYPYWQSKVEACQQCEYRTLEIDVNTIKTATTSREGLEEVIEDCKYCDYHHEYEQVIPMIQETDNDSGSSGGSFGGGSSSGGGASGSW